MVFVNLIFNRNSQNIIGFEDKLLYSIPNDMKWFKNVTSSSTKNVIIMGYNTWLSIPRKPLKDGINIIITKNHYKEAIDSYGGLANIFQSYEEAIQYVETIDYHKIFIIGGSQLYDYVYQKYLDTIEAFYETKVDDLLWGSMERDIKFCNISIPYDYKIIYKKEQLCQGKINVDNVKKYLPCSFMIHVKQTKINQDEQQYLDLLYKIHQTNNIKDSRNSKVISSFGEKMIFDLRNGFPLLTTKKMGWKTILRELLWFISGSTDNKVLQDKNVHIWDQNASKEFLESRGLSNPEGDLGPVYGFQWRHFGAEYKGLNANYNGCGVDQLQNVIDMIKHEPMSRRIIMSAWNPVDLDKMALPPCHVMVQFNIDNEFIDAQLYQRSGDMFLGVPYNIASYSFLLHIIGKITGYIPRYLHHVIGDAHIYENHIEQVETQLSRTADNFPQLFMKTISDINNISESDFQIVNYKSDDRIIGQMTA